jgi:hypothetical protein
MIHFATIHWNTDRWIAPQLAFLKRHLRQDYRVYAWLNNIPNPPVDLFHYASTEPVGPHGIKLNLLADIISASSSRPDDIIIFIDGDAFPIAEVEPYVTERLKRFKLIAVQRLENDGDVQPHPCFCATTLGFWRDLKGDWKEGHRWTNGKGEAVTSVGGNLLKQLTDHRIDWLPILRSNKTNPHPLFFGIYGDIVYHHGAGFRKGECRVDRQQLELGAWGKVFSKVIPGYERRKRRKFVNRMLSQNEALSEEIYQKVLSNPEFYREFI